MCFIGRRKWMAGFLLLHPLREKEIVKQSWDRIKIVFVYLKSLQLLWYILHSQSLEVNDISMHSREIRMDIFLLSWSHPQKKHLVRVPVTGWRKEVDSHTHPCHSCPSGHHLPPRTVVVLQIFCERIGVNDEGKGDQGNKLLESFACCFSSPQIGLWYGRISKWCGELQLFSKKKRKGACLLLPPSWSSSYAGRSKEEFPRRPSFMDDGEKTSEIPHSHILKI